MFWIPDDPSSGSLVQCMAKNYKDDSIMSVDMDKVGAFIYTEPNTHTHNASEYAAIRPNLSMSTDTIQSF